MIKAGRILYAVLDTDINSDYPETQVMATIVGGKFKGAKLLGTLSTGTDHNGNNDRVMLKFTTMSMKQWPNSISVAAVP